MKNFTDYIDYYGLVINGDTGDSCRETGTALSGGQTGLQIENCYTSQGWVRHPHPTEAWHADPTQFSRDQWEGLMCGLIETNNSVYLSNTWALQKMFRAQNGDIVSWEYNLYIRAFKKYYLYPVLILLDLGLVVSVLIRVITSFIDQNNTGDDINVSTMAILAVKHMPTPLSLLAALLYRLYKGGVLRAFQQYYQRPEAPPMDELLKPELEKYL